ncbi:MAG: hypothetical protein ACYDAE_00305 [Steroidobacteraceae bacterium]
MSRVDYREGYIAEQARQVAKSLRRDDAIKRRILYRSPHLLSTMDASELQTASARELAARELKELGVEVGDGDPIQLLDMHHAGRKFARDRDHGPGTAFPIMGGKPAEIFNPTARDASEPSLVDKYLSEDT